MNPAVASINISSQKGVPKTGVPSVMFIQDHGIANDAHAGGHHRQVSLLGLEHVESLRDKGLDVGPGVFAENITTRDVDIQSLAVGDIIRLGETVELEVTQIGKECHEPCAIYHQAGQCAMPLYGVFTRVLKGGTLKVGDAVDVLRSARG